MPLPSLRGAWRPLLAAIAFWTAVPVAGAAVSSERSPLAASAPALALPLPDSNLALRLAEPEPTPADATAGAHPNVLPNVARSLVLPGWGALHAGHRDVGLGFLAAEAALWTTVAVSAGQGHLRKGSSEDTAQLYAGIDLTGHDDDFRKLVSNYKSSDEYNRLVVYREAAARYYGDIDNYNAYIDTHSLTGADSWNWESDDEWERYHQLRKSSERAFQRARFAAVGLVVNRVAAAIVSSRLTPHPKDTAGRESSADDGMALGHLQWSVEPLVSAGSRLDLRHRVAWVISFE